ncbi:MAG: DegQ family serine endoprotease [Planctomycetota bacterium]
MRRLHLQSLAVALLLVLSVLAFPVEAAEDQNPDTQVLRALSRAIARAAAQVKPAVVSIYTTHVVEAPNLRTIPGFPFDFGPFGTPRRPDREGREPERREFRRRGLGSGFIVDAGKGYVVTNHHVVAGAEDIKVRLADDHEFDAKIVGTDKKTDLAVVRIEATGLKAVKLGDSDRIQVGEFVLAVGSPFGLRQTVSAGIVSAKGRGNLGIEDYEDFIQTDAAINRGNSGGPLVDIEGRVIGVNTAILSRTGGSVGVGFAIPVNMARQIVDQLIKSGKVTRGWLGVGIQDVTPNVAEQFGLDKPDGALVSQVFEGTPAAKAGLKVGDVIIEFGGKHVAGVTKLRNTVATIPPGTTVEIVVIRDKKRKTLTAEIARLSEDVLDRARGETTAEALGMSVQTLTPELAERLGIEQEKGVVVTGVEPGSAAAEKGIAPRNVIAEVNRQAVNNVAEFRAALRKADVKKGVLLLIVADSRTRFVVLKSGD